MYRMYLGISFTMYSGGRSTGEEDRDERKDG